MAEKRLSELTAATELQAADVLLLLQEGETKQLPAAVLQPTLAQMEAAQAAQVAAEAAQGLAQTARGAAEAAQGLAETAQGAAEDARDDAQAAAATAGDAATAAVAAMLPPIEAGDGDKMLVVTDAEDGYELQTPAQVRANLNVPDTGTVTSMVAGVVSLGYRVGLTPRYKDTDELYFDSGALEINGTVYTLAAETAMDIDAALGAAFSAGTWYFLGFNTPVSGTGLSAAELSVTTAPPTWDPDKRGRYDANGARVFNRCLTDGSANLDSKSLWAGPRGGLLQHGSAVLLSDTTPSATIEALAGRAAPWGVPVTIGGFASAQYSTAGAALLVYSGSATGSGDTYALVLKTQATGVSVYGTYLAVTNPIGQIFHKGDNHTYTDYVIYKSWDIMPDGV